MESLFPQAMFAARRAICPGCGAPLAIQDAQPKATCGYCGRISVLERRLRHFEPGSPRERKVVQIDWTPSHLLPGALREEISCDGCGHSMAVEGMNAIVRCDRCQTETRIERRMRLVSVDVEAPADEDAETIAMIDGVTGSMPLADRIAIATEAFAAWSHINTTLARRVGRLLETMESSDPLLAHAIEDGIGKLVCEKDVRFCDAVLLAAERHLGSPRVSYALLSAIGLGPGRCLKPLLDAADVLWRQGCLEKCCAALLAANCLLGRNYPDHPVLAEIILYRLPYLSGPVFAWALRFVQRRGSVIYLYPDSALLRFVDDCAAERPELAPEIGRTLGYYAIETEGEYRARLDLFGKLQSAEAKEWYLRSLCAPPGGSSLRLFTAAADLVVPLVEDERLGSAATVAVVRLLEKNVPAKLHDLVRRKGDALPEDLRRAYAKRVPNSPHLSPLPVKYWESEKPPERDAKIVEAERLLDEGIKLACAAEEGENQDLGHYGRVIQERTPLMIAVMRGDLGQVRGLLGAGADPNETNPHGRTALMFAAEEGRLEIARELIKRGARTDLRDKDGKTALMLAAEEDRVEILRAVGATPEQRQEALLSAIRRRKIAAVRILLELGADPDPLEEDGASQLILAARDGRAELLRALLDGGAHVHHQDNRGRTALWNATTPEIAALLLERGADPDLPDAQGETPLHAAVREGRTEVVRLLAPRVREINARGPDGKSALTLARENGGAEIARILTEAGASIAGDTRLLFEALEARDAEKAGELLAAGMDPNARDSDGRPALYRGLYRSRPELARLLLDRGADPNGRGVLHRAVVVCWPELVEDLLRRGADPNQADEYGHTPLMEAAVKGTVDLARLLLKSGADPRKRDGKGNGPIEWARMRRDNEEMIRILQEAGS